MRFVMPPRASDQDPVEVELKIESFLRDVTQMYLDVHFTWPAPSLPGAEIAPIDLLNQLEIFITNNALKFIGA